MGQKVGGYRRNVPYGKETVLLSVKEKSTTRDGWMFDVNPKGLVGWNRGTSGRKEKEYGSSVSDGKRLRKELEEVRRASGCESNGMGRKGTRQTGYVVYGEYTSPSWSHSGTAENSKQSRKRGRTKKRDQVELNVARERVAMNFEKHMNVKVDRKRVNLKDRRKEKGLEREKKERRSVLGHSSKRRKADERCEAIALSGTIPTTKRLTNLIVRELESGVNHMEVLRNRESVRRHHSKSSQTGRKRLGLDTLKDGSTKKGGYYGFNVTVKGPLEGARRTMVYVVQQGTIPRGTKRARMMITQEHAKTKVGSLGVRVTYCYGLG